MKLKKLTFLLMLGLGTLASKAQTFEWAKQFGDSANILYSGTGVDDARNVYCWGKINPTKTLDMDPGAGTQMLPQGSNGFISKLDPSGNFLWGKEIIRYANVGKCAIDPTGNIYSAGTFSNNITIDPQSNFQLSGGTKNVFIARWDSAGTLLWGKKIEGIDIMNKIITDASGAIVITGTIASGSTVDFDPGTDSFWVTSAKSSTYVLRLDAAGNFESAFLLRGTTVDVFLDPAGNYYIPITVVDSIDVDPGPDTVVLRGSQTNNCHYIIKYDASGQFKWLKTFKSTYVSSIYVSSINVDPSGNVYVTGAFVDTVDFNSGGTPMVLTDPNFGHTYVAKINEQGQTVWAKKIPAGYYESGAVDALGNYYLTVAFNGIIGPLDVDPGPGTVLLETKDKANYILKLSPAGEFIWVTLTHGNFWELSILVNGSGEVFSSGTFLKTVDFDPGTDSFYQDAKYSKDIFIVKMSQDSCDNIVLGIDSIHDVSCSSTGYISSYIHGGQTPYTYIWDSTAHAVNDSVAAPVNGGTYTLSVIDGIGCAKQITLLIQAPKTGNVPDLNAFLASRGRVVPGLSQSMRVHVSNDVCASTSGSVTLVKDNRVSLSQISPAPDSVSGDSLTWKFSNLVYATPFIPSFVATASTGLTFQDTVIFRLVAYDSLGDSDSSNNQREYVFFVFASYDPNDLQVNPGGQCEPAYVLKDRKLTYTVRFQNTGNYKATNVFVLDSLSHDLDINSLKIVAKSHPQLAIEVLPGNVINFRFDDINLPDSNQDESGSHGFFVFDISPKPGLAEFTVIENKVGIYFDFNAPVITNTVKNTYINKMPSLLVTQTGKTLTATDGAVSYEWVDCADNTPVPGANQKSFTPAKSGTYFVRVNMQECAMVSECFAVQMTGVGSIFQQQTDVYPNPSNGELTVNLARSFSQVEVSVNDMQGRLVQQHSGEGQNFSFMLNTVPGIYLVSVRTDEGVAVFKVIRK